VVTSQDKRRVIRSGRRRAVPQAVGATANDTRNAWTDVTRCAVVKTMFECRDALSRTNCYQSLRDSILEKLEVDQIVCFGIGNLAPSPTASMWQLACALALRETMQGDREIPLLFYDPCTSLSEAKVMSSEWEIQVITENERGKRCVNGLATLFFMPHCPLTLYGNVLWANWNNLDRVLAFGNSLPMYKERAIEKRKVPETISLLLPFVKEERVDISKRDAEEANGDLEGAFNDCYLTWFAIDGDAVLPCRPELTTQGDDGEVI